MLFVDLDGTLLSVERRHYAAYVAGLEGPDTRGVPLPEREYWALRRAGTDPGSLLARSRLLPTRRDAFRRAFEARLEAPELLGLDVPRPGAATLLAKLHTKTPIVLLAQRRDRHALDEQLADLQLRPYFAEVLSGAPGEPRRPDRDLRWRHKAALVRARYGGALPTEALLIGDTETDVRAGRNLGFEVWLVEGGHRSRALQLKADPDRIVPSLTAAADLLMPGGRWQR